jgi:hypothetical protein
MTTRSRRSGADSADDAPEPAEDTGGRTTDTTDGRDNSGGSSGTKYLNTSGGPLTYDAEGHQVDAGGWTPEITLDEIGRAARKRGFLLPPSAL